MFIQLNEDRAIKADAHQYILCKKSTKKNKATGEVEEVWKNDLYFTTLKGLFKAVPEVLLRESNAKGWGECLIVLEDVLQLLNKVFEEGGSVRCSTAPTTQGDKVC